MSTTPFYLQQFENINGSPCAGGKLRAYVQGTSTPVNLYLDAALTVIAPRPLVLDAQGYVPQFWVSSAAGILFELRQADDALVWTRDYVQASGGGGTGGTVLSVTAELDAGLETAMQVTSMPVTTSGAITIEGVAGLPHLALMTPEAGVGKPSMREIQTSDVSGLDDDLASFLPLAGGTMEDTGQIQYEATADAFSAGLYWGGTDWARISRWGLYWEDTANRSGFQLYPTTGAGTFFSLERKGGGGQDVAIYGHGDGGYAYFRGATGQQAVSLGAEPASGNGSINVKNGAGEWTLAHSSSSSDVTLSTTQVRILQAHTGVNLPQLTSAKTLGTDVDGNVVEAETGSEVMWIRADLGNGATPPGSPQTGDTYWIAAGNSGAFAAWEYGFARWTGTEWIFIERITKQLVWLSDNPANSEGSLYQVLSVGGGLYFLVKLYHTVVNAKEFGIGPDCRLLDLSHPNNYVQLTKSDSASGSGAGLLIANQGTAIPALVLQDTTGNWTSLNSVSNEMRVRGFSDTAPQDGGVWKSLRALDLSAEGSLKTASTTRIDNIGGAFLTNATISSLTNGVFPLAGAAGLLGNSSLSETATSVKSTKPVDVNGATRPAWAFWTVPIQLSNESAMLTINGSKGDQVGFARNFYTAADGFQYPISTRTAGGYPTELILDDQGRLRFFASQTAPTVGVAVTDLAQRFAVDRFGGATMNSISISTPVTREAIIQPLPITNSAPGVVTVGPSGGVKSFGFDGNASTEELFYHLDVQHDYVAGTDMVFHVHWTPATATGGDVKWQIEYQWVEAGGTWPAPTTASSTAAAGTTAWADKRADFTISGAGHTYNSRILFRLFRNPTDAADTYTGDAVLTSVGIHYSANIGQP